MGLASDRKRDRRSVDESPGVRVIEVIDMKESFGLVNAPGVVAILDSFQDEPPQDYVGKTARISAAHGGSFEARIEGVRDHGGTISLFFRGMTSGDIPIGSLIELDG